MIRVLLVDDQPLARAGLKLILSPADGFTIVGECADGAEVLDALVLRPDVIVMDVRMKGVDGVEATRRLRTLASTPPVLILTTFGDDEVLSAALRAGAAGFVLKDALAEDLIRATRTVAQGGAWLDPAVTTRVLHAYRSGTTSPPNAAGALAALTPRELEVLRLIGRGASNQEIADALIIGEATVKSHVGNILGKLDLRDRAAAIVFAFDHGLVQPAGS
ncbi:MAG: response regulator transcription factor [Kouleothrix sp.]|jgi:DNA-binding NarL/FixJ family response regulator|nr:response regulator transcription factor [Kouleothrix sp.]